MSETRALGTPRDAALLGRIDPRIVRAFRSVRKLEKRISDVSADIAAWSASSFLAKMTGMRAVSTKRRELEALKAEHAKRRDAFERLARTIRKSDAYVAAKVPAPKQAASATAGKVRPPKSPASVVPPKTPAALAPEPVIPSTEMRPAAIAIVPDRETVPIEPAEEPGHHEEIDGISIEEIEGLLSGASRHIRLEPTAEKPAPFRLTSRPTGSRIDHLFESRRIEVPDPGPLLVRGAYRVYLPIPKSDVDEAVSLGAKLGPKGGVSVPADGDLAPFDRWLPFHAKREIEPIAMDSIPVTSWGASLSNLLTQASWDAVRAPSIERTGDACIVCGYAARSGSVDCHEIWDYHVPADNGTGVQRLVDVLAVCKECHECFHLGLARVNKHLDVALGRMAWINRWSAKETDEYYAYSGNKWFERGRRDWTLDLSILGDDVRLVLKGGETGTRIDDAGDLLFDAWGKPGRTRLVGVRFGHAGQESRNPLPAIDYTRYRRDV